MFYIHVWEVKRINDMSQLMGMWRDEIKRKDLKSWETNVHPWFTRATLDAIGSGGRSSAG